MASLDAAGAASLVTSLEASGTLAFDTVAETLEPLNAYLGPFSDVPYAYVGIPVITAVYLLVTPGIALGALDTYLIAPLDKLLEKVDVNDIKKGKKIGDGTFGQVYLGQLREADVIIKVAKPGSEAIKLQLAEEYMNRRLRRWVGTRFLSANFLGSCQANLRFGAAPDLVWEYEGQYTLEEYMADSDFPFNLEESLFGKELSGDYEKRAAKSVQRIMKQLLKSLEALHGTGIVHRDVKPANIVYMDGRFKMIDFGGAADLRVGKNYQPDQQLLDPYYCPPEMYVMPESTPAPPPPPVAAALSPLLWQLNRPDLFDTYSLGLILLQMGIPNLRQKNSMSPQGTFQRNLIQSDYDLKKWRKNYASEWDFSILDQSGGWQLACSLVKKRDILRRGRLSATECLIHPFLLL